MHPQRLSEKKSSAPTASITKGHANVATILPSNKEVQKPDPKYAGYKRLHEPEVLPPIGGAPSFLVFPPTPTLSPPALSVASGQTTGAFDAATSTVVNTDVIGSPLSMGAMIHLGQLGVSSPAVRVRTPMSHLFPPLSSSKATTTTKVTPGSNPKVASSRARKKQKTGTDASKTEVKSVVIDPDTYKFAQMHANIGMIEKLPVMNPSARLEASRLSVESIRKALLIPPPTRRLIRLKRKREQALPWEEQLICVISAGEEQRLLHDRLQLMWEGYMQMSPEQRTDNAMFRRFVQFFQLKEAEPEIDYKDVCLRCAKPYIVNRVRSTLQCPHCGLMVRYLTVRSNIRMATTRTSQNPATTSEYKQYSRFIANLRQYIQSGSTTEHDPVLHHQIRQAHGTHDHYRAAKTRWKPGEVKKELAKIGLLKSMGALASKIADSMNGTPKAILSQEQHDEIVKLLRMLQIFYVHKHGQPEWVLPGPKFAFTEICRVRQWDKLLSLFPLPSYDSTQIQREQIRWDRFSSVLFERDRSTSASSVDSSSSIGSTTSTPTASLPTTATTLTI